MLKVQKLFKRKMFLLQYALEVKLGEKTRLETIIKEEESRLRKEEAELKLAEQAFDNFLRVVRWLAGMRTRACMRTCAHVACGHI